MGKGGGKREERILGEGEERREEGASKWRGRVFLMEEEYRREEGGEGEGRRF